jgi:hypothetical protein
VDSSKKLNKKQVLIKKEYKMKKAIDLLRKLRNVQREGKGDDIDLQAEIDKFLEQEEDRQLSADILAGDLFLCADRLLVYSHSSFGDDESETHSFIIPMLHSTTTDLDDCYIKLRVCINEQQPDDQWPHYSLVITPSLFNNSNNDYSNGSKSIRITITKAEAEALLRNSKAERLEQKKLAYAESVEEEVNILADNQE